MVVGTMFTLFVVPVFYSLIAAEHGRTAPAAQESETPSVPAMRPVEEFA